MLLKNNPVQYVLQGQEVFHFYAKITLDPLRWNTCEWKMCETGRERRPTRLTGSLNLTGKKKFHISP